MLKNLSIASLILFTASPVFASSDAAWAEFAAQVERGCLNAAEGLYTEASAVVDPFGSESYGLAIVTGQGADGLTLSAICVFNKHTEAVEIGGELDVTVTSR